MLLLLGITATCELQYNKFYMECRTYKTKTLQKAYKMIQNISYSNEHPLASQLPTSEFLQQQCKHIVYYVTNYNLFPWSDDYIECPTILFSNQLYTYSKFTLLCSLTLIWRGIDNVLLVKLEGICRCLIIISYARVLCAYK